MKSNMCDMMTLFLNRMPNIVRLLSKEFIALIAIAVALAMPLAWLLNNLWLQKFAYRIDIGVMDFGLGILFTLLLAMLTISSQAFKAARANPVESLRNE